MSDELPKRKTDLIRTPMTAEHLANLRKPKAKRVVRTYTVNEFCFNLSTGLILHRPSGAMWVAAMVDRRCAAVEVDGEFIAPSEWLKRQARKA